MNEDVFPVEHEDFPMSCYFSGVYVLRQGFPPKIRILGIWLRPSILRIFGRGLDSQGEQDRRLEPQTHEGLVGRWLSFSFRAGFQVPAVSFLGIKNKTQVCRVQLKGGVIVCLWKLWKMQVLSTYQNWLWFRMVGINTAVTRTRMIPI